MLFVHVEVYLFLVFHKLLQTNKRFTLKMYSDDRYDIINSKITNIEFIIIIYIIYYICLQSYK
jgi:hypothetical protein